MDVSNVRNVSAVRTDRFLTAVRNELSAQISGIIRKDKILASMPIVAAIHIHISG